MRLSDGVEWGLHCAVVLASLPDEVALAGRDLAEFHGVSESYLVKHLQAMARAGVLESLPGPRGGYRLARRPDEITMLDVVEAIDGRGPVFRCTEIRRRGPAAVASPAVYRAPCVISAAMMAAEVAWRGALRARTLADVAAEVAGNADAGGPRAGAAWLSERIRR
jgi:Rrf2 family protein